VRIAIETGLRAFVEVGAVGDDAADPGGPRTRIAGLQSADQEIP